MSRDGPDSFIVLVLKLSFLSILLPLVFSAIDVHYNTLDTAGFGTILWINVLFIVSGIAAAAIMFVLYIILDIDFIPSETGLILIVLFLSAVIMYFVKQLLISYYELIIGHQNIVVISQLVIMTIVPFTVYWSLQGLGKSYMH